MRFSAPRTPSPPPTMREYRNRSTFGVPSDSEDEESFYSEVDDGSSDSASTSGESYLGAGQRHARYESDEDEEEAYLSDDLEEILTLSRPKRERPKRSAAEEHYLSEALASVRLRANHHDPYEEWKADLKEESLRVARHNQSLAKSLRHRVQHATHAHVARLQAEDLATTRQRAREYVTAINERRDKEMERLRTEWEARNKLLWEHIEGVIGKEEERARAAQEAERKKREEEERVRREEEERRRKVEEEKRREEEERRKEREREEEEARQASEAEKAEKARKEKEEQEAEQRKELGFLSASEDWQKARQDLMWLKTGPMKTVKENKELKSLWNAGRRAITPKVGQLTNDQATITRISHEVVEVVLGSPRHPEPVYFALLSSLAKAILLQAETEVTAEKRSARPLAQVAAHALGALAGFAEAFWAKLVQRAGGWPVPAVVPSVDIGGRAFAAGERRKALGFREEEGFGEYTARVTGLMRVYFHVLCADAGAAPLEPVFRLPRMWTYFARMLAEPALLKSSVAPSLLHAALDIGGVQAKQVWGKQWVKMLAQLYDAATVGLEGAPGTLLGGSSAEGIAARVRVQLEIERIMAQ